MRKPFFLAALAALIVACTPTEQPAPSKPVVPTTPTKPEEPVIVNYSFSASTDLLSFSAEGGTETFQLTTDASWEADTGHDSWIQVSPASGKGNTTITVTVGQNPDSDSPRRGWIDFTATGKNVTGSLSLKVEQDREERVPDPDPTISVTVTASVTPSTITRTSANIVCSYSGAPATGVSERGLLYGTSPSELNQELIFDSKAETSATYTYKLSNLTPATTYYYQAYVVALDGVLQKYIYFYSGVNSFTTTSDGQTVNGLQYLNCYEIPAISLKSTSACSDSGSEYYSSTKWYNYLTSNDNQKVVTHTYKYNSKQYRNYTCLVDKDKKAPLWSAFVMHKKTYPDNNVGRADNSYWHSDPGIDPSWQSCFATGNGNEYSRGHFVASNYRQTVSDANYETFYYTNQALQWQNGFNSGVWSSLEEDVARNAPSSSTDTLYVVVGVLYEGNVTRYNSSIQANVPVPSHFYKLLMKCSFNTSGTMTAAKGCAYLFTNEAQSGNYSQGITTIDAIEQRSGWDFFTNVPKSLQDTAEAQRSAVW